MHRKSLEPLATGKASAFGFWLLAKDQNEKPQARASLPMQAKIGLARTQECGPQNVSTGEKAMSREEILTSIKGLAEKLGRVPSLTELKTMTPVGRRAVATNLPPIQTR